MTLGECKLGVDISRAKQHKQCCEVSKYENKTTNIAKMKLTNTSIC